MNTVFSGRTFLVLSLAAALGGGALPAAAAAPDAPASTSPDALASTTALGMRTSVQKTVTGSVPFDSVGGPGFDTSPDDSIVRSHDSVTYTVELQLSGAATDNRVVIRQVLPDGLQWPAVSQLPGYCTAGSTVSDDRSVVECVRTNVLPNSVSAVDLTALLVDAPPHGSVVNSPRDGITAVASDPSSGSEIVSTTTAPDVVVSSAPRVNVGVKRGPIVSGVTEQDGTPGWYIAHDAYLSVTGFSTDAGRGTRGAGNVSEDVTFQIDLSGYPAGARLATVNPESVPVAQSCLVGAFDTGSFPRSSGGGAGGVTDSGSWRCVTSPDGRIVSVTVSGADLSGDHIPTRSVSGASISTEGYLAIGRFGVFVPDAEVPANGSLPVSLELTQLRVVGVDVDGAPLDNAPEPLTDNGATATLAQRTGAGSHTSRYQDRRTDNRLVPGQSTLGSGDGPVAGGQLFEQSVTWNNTSTVPLTDAIMCAVFDPKTQHMAQRPSGAAPVETNSTGGAVVVEYGTTPSVDPTADDVTRHGQMDATTCDDGDDTWVDDPSSVGLDNVTKVRVRPVSDELPARAGISLWVQLQAKEGIEVGTPVTETYSIKSSGNGPDRTSPTEWVESGWWHGVYRAAAGNNAFPRGDQLIASTAAVSIAKRAVSPATEPGAPTPIAAGSDIGFELRAQILTPDAAANAATGVVVTDSLPAGFTFDAESASPEATTVETQADGSTLIEWQLGTVRRGAEPVIAYRASASPFTVGQFLNRVIVSSPDDPTSLTAFPEEPGHQNAHYAYQTVLVSSPSGLQLDKTVDRAVVEAGDPVGYHVDFANMSAEQPQQDVRLIDVLPFPGDARGSTAQGVLAGAPASEAVLRYTAAPGAEVSENVDADDGSGFGQLPEGFDWCASDAFGSVGCPESFGDVTAIEATVAELPPFSPVSIDYELATDQSAADARFMNDAVVHSATQTLGARSPVVAARLVSSAIGERVWWDVDGNGLDDDGPDGTRGTGVEGVELELSGTDKHGVAVIRSLTTDTEGRYEFAGLLSGDYRIEVRLPDGMRAEPTVPGIGDDPLMNSAIDPGSMAMSGIVIEDPSPTAADGQDLRWNGGLIADEPDEVTGPGVPSGPGTSGALAVTGPGVVTGALLLGGLLVLCGLLTVSLRRARRRIES